MRISDWSSDVCSSDLLDIAHAGHAPQFVHDPRIGEIAEFQRARMSRIRTDCNQEEESRIGLLNRYALPPDLFGQALLNQRQFILHVPLSLVDVRAGLEGYGVRRGAIGVAGRRHIEQALYAIQLLLDQLSDIQI